VSCRAAHGQHVARRISGWLHTLHSRAASEHVVRDAGLPLLLLLCFACSHWRVCVDIEQGGSARC
jgi:hypothetical protein